jgi:hypothetical protein
VLDKERERDDDFEDGEEGDAVNGESTKAHWGVHLFFFFFFSLAVNSCDCESKANEMIT